MPCRLPLPAVLLLATALSCTSAPAPEPEPVPGLRQPDEALVRKVEAVRARVEADTCFDRTKPDSGCAWTEHPFDASEFAMADSTGEAILIVDTLPGLSPAMFRHRRRLKGYFRPTEDGVIAPARYTWRLPATVHDALDAFATPEFIPSEWLAPVAEPLQRRFPISFPETVTHGSNVFALLVETSPRQPIILLDSLNLETFAPGIACDASEAGLTAFRERVRQVAASLRQLLGEHNVRFINVSRGDTFFSVRDTWSQHCGTPLPPETVLRGQLEALAPIYDVLFNTPGVFAAHAAIDGTGSHDYPFDGLDARYPFRLRMGFYQALESGLDAQGRGPYQQLEGWPALADVDVFFNSGVLKERPFPYNSTPYLIVDTLGVSISPVSHTTTSWITPLGLARFISLRDGQYAGQELTAALVGTIQQDMVPEACPDLPRGRCMYQDPLLHGQVEAVRLGYRSREYTAP